VQTLVQIEANRGKDPEVIDAAACTFLHEGREAELRCRCATLWSCFSERTTADLRARCS
jgi:hypothetical protein